MQFILFLGSQKEYSTAKPNSEFQKGFLLWTFLMERALTGGPVPVARKAASLARNRGLDQRRLVAIRLTRKSATMRPSSCCHCSPSSVVALLLLLRLRVSASVSVLVRALKTVPGACSVAILLLVVALAVALLSTNPLTTIGRAS